MPPVPPHKIDYPKYVDSLWCIYVVSVVGAWNAEFGKSNILNGLGESKVLKSLFQFTVDPCFPNIILLTAEALI